MKITNIIWDLEEGDSDYALPREIDVPKILETIDSRLDNAKVRSTKGDEKVYIDEIEEIAANYNAKINSEG